MFDTLDTAISTLREVVAALRPEVIDGRDAARLLERVCEGERLCAAAKTLLAPRVEECNAWTGHGHRSAAEWLAATAGTTVGAAVGTLETARRLGDLPATENALRSGWLSESQAREVSTAAAAAPVAEASLLRAAEVEGVPALRDRSRRVRAAACTDETARYERVRRARYHRRWTDEEGARCGAYRLTPDAGAEIEAALRAHLERIMREATSQDRHEPEEAYAADALVAMAKASCGGGNGPDVVMHVRVDHSAFVRERTVEGETCEVAGVGPIPVATARALASDSILYGIVTKGIDVTTIANLGRTVSAALRAALEYRDHVCRVLGCTVQHGLEIHHKNPVVDLGESSLENTVRMCHWHHYLVTHQGYRLEPSGDGDYRLVAPDDPDPPGSRAPDAVLVAA